MPVAAFTKLPFDEAAEFLRDKVNLPTETWQDIQRGMHSKAFVVAGAMKNELLADIKSEVLKAIEQGTTLNDFRKQFRGIVQKHGWHFKQSFGWRSAVIYDTNLRTAFSAGNEDQLQRTKDRRPYARYIGGLSAEPRPLHLEWNGLVLPIDHPFWQTHTPPNGWGCKCKKVSVSQRELERDGLKVADKAPDNGTYLWKDKDGKTHTIPRGIDPLWDYNPGRSAWGEQLSERAMAEWAAEKGNAWESLTPTTWEDLGRPEQVPLDAPKNKIDPSAKRTEDGIRDQLRSLFGGDEKIVTLNSKGFRYDTVLNANVLARHVDPVRAPFLPLIEETVTEPFEVWQTFDRHKGTGKVVLRHRFVKSVDAGKSGNLMLVANVVAGKFEGWTFVPTRDRNYLNRQRRGNLIYER